MRSARIRRVLALGLHIPGVRRVRQVVMRARFTRDLRRLNDVLAKTPLAGHYAVTGGLLLGWARNRAILLDDVRDADFTYLIEDASLFDASVPSLMRAGFVPAVRFVNNDGLSVEHRFIRHRSQFEFFALVPANGRTRYFMYDEPDELVCERAYQEFESFRFLERTWRKPADHEAVLVANYGDWRNANPDWHYTLAGTVIQRHTAVFGPSEWIPSGSRKR
jgi:hypothetical protein